MKKEISINEKLYQELMDRIGENGIADFMDFHLMPFLIYRNFETLNNSDFSYQEEANQKDDFDFFRFHNWQTYTYLGRLIIEWQPEKKEYDNLHEACQEFLSYYRAKTNQNFPDEYLFRMEEFVGLKLNLLS